LRLKLRRVGRINFVLRHSLQPFLLQAIILALLLYIGQPLPLQFRAYALALRFGLTFAASPVFCGLALGLLALDVVESLLFLQRIRAALVRLSLLARFLLGGSGSGC